MGELRVYEVIGTYPRTADKTFAGVVCTMFREKQKRYSPKVWEVRKAKQIALLDRDWCDWWLGDLTVLAPEIRALAGEEQRRAIQSIRVYIESSFGGPTQGYNRKGGSLKLNVTAQLGELVLGERLGDGWTRLETLDVQDDPPVGWTHESHPWFIHRVRYQRFWQVWGPPIPLGGARDMIRTPFASDHRVGECYLPDRVLRPVLRPGEMRVVARDGLNVREQPRVTSRKVTAIPWASVITVVRTKYIDGNVWAEIPGGLWVCVEYNGQTYATY